MSSTILSAAAAADIHARNDSYSDQLRTQLARVAPSIDDVTFEVRTGKGHVVVLAEAEVALCVEVLSAATFTVAEIQHFDWSDDDDFDHDHEWLINFEIN